MRVYNINHEPSHKHDVLKTLTRFYKEELDKTEDKYNHAIAAKSYENYLKEKVKNPVLAEAAFMEYINESPIKHVFFFYEFKKELEQLPNINKLVNKIQDLKFKYPKTGYLREVIFANNRIKTDYVTEKLPNYKKMFLKLKWF